MRVVVCSVVFGIAFGVAVPIPAPAEPNMAQRLSARVQRVKTGFLKWKLATKERRAMSRIEKERGKLSGLGIHANVPVNVAAPKQKSEILAGLMKEAALLRGAREGSRAGERRLTLLGEITSLQQEIAAETDLVPEGSAGVSSAHGITLALDHTKGADLTQNLAHELTHSAERKEINRLTREVERLSSLPTRTAAQEKRLGRVQRRINVLSEQQGVNQGHDETRADFAGAYALGAQGKPLGERHLWGWRNADARYPKERMAQANIDGYLQGAELRMTGGERQPTPKERAYLDGYRAALEAQAKRSFETPPPDRPLGNALGRVKLFHDKTGVQIARSLRATPDEDAAWEAGRSDAMNEMTPHL